MSWGPRQKTLSWNFPKKAARIFASRKKVLFFVFRTRAKKNCWIR